VIRCDFGAECAYPAQCPDCDMCWDHCQCGAEDETFVGDESCHHGVGFDEDCEDCDDESAEGDAILWKDK